VIFRFDEREIEQALKMAVARGVFVHALIAYTNGGGEKNLRKIEARLLAAGVTVARTADDLARYHGKLMIIDRQILYLMAFNYTYLDMNHSRSFGLVTRNEQIVQEAVKLFEADTTRQPYAPAQDNFIVSPANARKELTAFIAGAQKQLLIYDGKLTDSQIIRLLQDRARAGVEVRVIGKLGKRGAGIKTVKLSGLRLHAQAIIRDGAQVFLGSQSLRKAELDVRREVGLITDDPNVVKQFLATFDADWSMSESAPQPLNQKKEAPVALAAMLKEAVKDVVKGVVVEAGVVAPELKKEMKEAVHEAVKEAVKEAVSETDPIT
jgi:phosphatidylserine/phosphatidylglycerophosphate/cardiolipin synthase-like enzyme